MVNSKYDFVLSTGRTGTVALSNVLKSAEGVHCFHEPRHTRRFKLIGNYYHNRVLPGAYQKQFLRPRKKWLNKDASEHLIEINPMIWRWGECILDNFKDTKILHVTRDIRTWMLSEMNYYTTPFAYCTIISPYWELRPNVFLNGDTFENPNHKKLLRWVKIWEIKNKYIQNLPVPEKNYLRVKYEDIFSKDSQVQTETLNVLADFLEIKLDLNKVKQISERRVNATRRKKYSYKDIITPDIIAYLKKPEQFDLIQEYGYDF